MENSETAFVGRRVLFQFLGAPDGLTEKFVLHLCGDAEISAEEE